MARPAPAAPRRGTARRTPARPAQARFRPGSRGSDGGRQWCRLRPMRGSGTCRLRIASANMIATSASLAPRTSPQGWRSSRAGSGSKASVIAAPLPISRTTIVRAILEKRRKRSASGDSSSGRPPIQKHSRQPVQRGQRKAPVPGRPRMARGPQRQRCHDPSPHRQPAARCNASVPATRLATALPHRAIRASRSARRRLGRHGAPPWPAPRVARVPALPGA